MFPLQILSIALAGSLYCRVHKDLIRYLEGYSDSVRNEVILMYRQWLRQGFFSVHTGRFKFHAGTRAYEQLKHFLATCPFVEMVENYKTGQKCRRYCFVLRAVSVVETENESLGLVRVLPSYTVLVVVSCQWLDYRRERWLSGAKTTA